MKKLLSIFIAAITFATPSFAEEMPPVESALAEWVKAVETGTVDEIVSLYDKDSVMLSAFAVDPLTNHAQLRDYFGKVVKEPNRKVDVTKQDVRRFGDVASNTGLYMFHYTQEGEPMDFPARFTFVYVLKDNKWSIISHHSSIVPGN
ncbi:MAG: SgcJ/EcaC family oxidoreductase [Rickettsiales bacterium]